MIEMKRPRIKKTVRKKIQSGKKLVKRTKDNTSNQYYAEMLSSPDEKTLDSETLIKVAQKRVSDSIVTGIEYSPLGIILRNFYVNMLIPECIFL